MAKFKYIARAKTGELQTGFVESESRESASAILSGHGLLVLSVESAAEKKWYDRFLDLFKRVKAADLMIFTRQFATLLDAKIPMADSLKNLYRQTRNPILKEAVLEISSDVDSGLSLSQALEKHSTIFSEFYSNMVRSAEITGRLDKVMVFLADYLEKEHMVFSKIRNAMIYPAVVIGLIFIVGGIMVGFVFPKLVPVFEESGVELPLITRALLGVGNFIADWWWLLIILIVVGIVSSMNYLRTAEGKAVFDQVVIKLPIFGDLFRKLYVARFAESVSVLIKGGSPVAQSLSIAANTMGSTLYREAIEDIAEAVRQGQLLSQAMEERGEYFPALSSQMVAVGEGTGKLDELLMRVSDFYTREVDDVVSNLVELIQPALMVFIGIAVGVLFAAVLVPMFSLVQTF
jgi:type IV pilus assembly protein PilC